MPFAPGFTTWLLPLSAPRLMPSLIWEVARGPNWRPCQWGCLIWDFELHICELRTCFLPHTQPQVFCCNNSTRIDRLTLHETSYSPCGYLVAAGSKKSHLGDPAKCWMIRIGKQQLIETDSCCFLRSQRPSCWRGSLFLAAHYGCKVPCRSWPISLQLLLCVLTWEETIWLKPSSNICRKWLMVSFLKLNVSPRELVGKKNLWYQISLDTDGFRFCHL